MDRVRNEKGLTLVETLVTIVVFILLVVFVVTFIGKAIDNPKEAEILNTLNHYQQGAEVTLHTSKENEDLTILDSTFNKELESKLKFKDSVTEHKNSYGNTYHSDVSRGGTQTYINVETLGKKEGDKYGTVTIKEGDIVESCTYGFGKRDKKLILLESDLCEGGNGVADPPFDHVTEVPDGCIGIYNDEDLHNMREGLDDCYIVMKPIDLTSSPYNMGGVWEPIGVDEPFTGILDGNGYEIKGLSVEDEGNYTGLFGKVSEAEIKNLVMRGVMVEGSGYTTGALVGEIEGVSSFTNVTITDAVVKGSGDAGGIAGYADLGESLEFRDISFTGDVKGNGNVGGVLGYIWFSGGEVIYENISVEGNIENEDKSTGGIVGSNQFDEGTLIVRNVGIKGSISGAGGTAGVIGDFYANESEVVVEGVKINAKVEYNGRDVGTFSGAFMGGMMGNSGIYDSEVNIREVDIKGIVKGENNIGGVIGNLTPSGGSFVMEKVNADVDVSGELSVGGLAGIYTQDKTDHNVVKEITLKGSVEGEENVGGFLGGYVGHDTITGGGINNSYSEVNVTGVKGVGGVAGMLHTWEGEEAIFEVENVYVHGDIKGNENVGGFFGYIPEEMFNYNKWYKVDNIELRVKNSFLFPLNEENNLRAVFGENETEKVKVDNVFVGDNSRGVLETEYGVNHIKKEEGKKGNTYINQGWDFDSVWEIDEGKGYPIFQWQ